MERSRQTRADQRRRRDVAEALAQLLRVARGEWNVRADGVPRFPGPEEQVVEAEARDRQVQRHPRSRPDEPERGGPDPRHDLGAEVSEPGAHVDPADPELGEPRDDGALHDGPWDPLRLADDQGDGGPADYNEHEENERHHKAGGSLSRRAAREPIVQWLECDVQDGDTDQPRGVRRERDRQGAGERHDQCGGSPLPGVGKSGQREPSQSRGAGYPSPFRSRSSNRVITDSSCFRPSRKS